MSDKDHRALEALKSTTCVCGKSKQRGMSHCRGCYFKLPLSVRRSLYKPLGEGYAEAYEQSCVMLSDLRAEELNPESTL